MEHAGECKAAITVKGAAWCCVSGILLDHALQWEGMQELCFAKIGVGRGNRGMLLRNKWQRAIKEHSCEQIK
jgi:hypothetical protein